MMLSERRHGVRGTVHQNSWRPSSGLMYVETSLIALVTRATRDYVGPLVIIVVFGGGMVMGVFCCISYLSIAERKRRREETSCTTLIAPGHTLSSLIREKKSFFHPPAKSRHNFCNSKLRPDRDWGLFSCHS